MFIVNFLFGIYHGFSIHHERLSYKHKKAAYFQKCPICYNQYRLFLINACTTPFCPFLQALRKIKLIHRVSPYEFIKISFTSGSLFCSVAISRAVLPSLFTASASAKSNSKSISAISFATLSFTLRAA